MRESREPLGRLPSLERRQIAVRGGGHTRQDHADVRHVDVGTSRGYRCREQAGSSLVEWIIETKHELERIGSNGADVKRRRKQIQPLFQQRVGNGSAGGHPPVETGGWGNGILRRLNK